METKYYFIGLEARLRTNNRYFNLDKAKAAAAFAAKTLNIPIRVFEMKANNYSALVEAITPENALEMNDNLFKDLMSDIYFS